MKIAILIIVIESSAVMLAILYFYYRRTQSGKRALVKSGSGKAQGSIHSPLKADIKI